MRLLRRSCLAVVVLFATSLTAAVTPTGRAVPNEVLVKVRSDASVDVISSLEDLVDGDSQRVATIGSSTLLRLRSRTKNVEALQSALAHNAQVEYVEPNYIVRVTAEPNDPSYTSLWGLDNTGQTISSVIGTPGADIDAEAAWNVTTGSSAVVVGVVDTGVDYNHPDLAANMWSNPGGKGNAICGAGTHGFNSLTHTCDPADDYGHGTHVAGTIGAVGNNNVGVAGVNWTASIMALKFLDYSGNGTIAGAIEAIDFAIQTKIDGVNVRVLSNSWGGFPFSKALLDVINKANENGILFVASAGNDGSSTDVFPHYPSTYNTPNMISVAATDNRDGLAYFSNYGATTVHLGAPGVSVYSTKPNNTYGFSSGTSMAAPHVAGVAALVLAASPSLTTAQVKSAILSNTDPLPSLTGKTTTGGRLNAAKAVGGTPTPDFTVAVTPVSVVVTQGSAATYTLAINRINGFSGTVDLSVSGLPAVASASFTPPTATTASTLVIATSGATPTGTATLAITATGGALTRTYYVGMTVVAPPTPTAGSCPAFSVGYGTYFSMPVDVAIGDFNRDGVPQFALVDAGVNRVYVQTGSAYSSYVTGTAPASLITADFNGDGRLDFATANSGSNDVSVLLAGTVTGYATANYAAGTSPFSVAAADLNADGKLDLAVANNGSGNVSVLLGNGDGTFAPAVHYATGSGPFWVTTTDVDRDGNLDLAVANFNANSISLLRGIGDGTFIAPLTLSGGTKPSSVAAGDFNNDGKPDLAVSNYGSNNVSLFLGNGDATFNSAVYFAVGLQPSSVAAGDLNGDGQTDLVTSNTGSGTLSILLANGAGSFNSAISVVTYYEPAVARIGEITLDGRPDILVPSADYGRMVFVYNDSVCSLNCGVPASAVAHSVGGTPDSAAAGDFNGDGMPDLAVVDNAANTVALRLGNGAGSFTAGTSVSAGTSPRGIATADFNRDGKADLAVASAGSNEVVILIGNGDGTFQNAVNYGTGNGPRSVAVGDFNRDGKTDLALAAYDANAVSILLGNGNGTFATAVPYTVGTNPNAVVAGDFDRDGVLDLATANSGSANVSVLKGNGNGTFQTATPFAAGTTPRALVAADLNRDGRLDLAVANGASNDVSVLLANGDLTFAAAVSTSVATTPYAILAVDMNGDGRLDLVTANNGSNDVSILMATNTSGYSAAVNYAAGLNPTALANADFNRDGKSDLAVVTSGAAGFSVLLNACPVADLTVTKTHAGAFLQGGTGNYTITVTNAGALATAGLVTVKDTLPLGLTANAMSGTGWTCVVPTTTCTRSDALAPGGSYPQITLTVNVQGTAAASVTNNVTVSGGGEVNPLNSSASDPTTVTPRTDLVLTKTHGGAFAQGASGRTYTLSVKNAGGLATSGTVTVTDTLPSGLSAVAMSGSGWSCSVGSLTCTRSDVLAGGGSYPPITLTVNVAGNASSLVTNTATVSGGGDAAPANNTASDPTIIWSSNTCGTFGSATWYPGSYSNGSTLAVGDFTSDGKIDVLTNDYQNLVVYPGNGDGTLGTSIKSPSVDWPVATAGDLNHDGKLDALAVYTGYDAKVVVYLGLGNGSFATGVDYDAGALSYIVRAELVDVNGDGNLDVLSHTSSYSGNTAVLYLGLGDGTLAPATTFALPSNVYAWTFTDTDSNGTVDLVAASSTQLHVMRGNGDGTFQTAVTSPTVSGMGYIDAGDFNGDGIPDIAGTLYDEVEIHLGNGNGTFAAGVIYDSSWSSAFLTLADINADGALDLVVASPYGYLSTLRGSGNGTFAAPDTYYLSSASSVAVTDFNGDGRADLALLSQYSSPVGVALGGCPDLTITKTHSGTFRGGKTGFYDITVKNTGGGAVNGTITVQDLLPAGLTATSIYGYPGTCTLETLTCTRNGSLNAGDEWDISLWVTISPAAATSITNIATVTGAGDTNPSNNVASDPTTIVHAPDLIITKSHTGTVWAAGQTGTYTISVGNVGTGPTSGTVTVTDSLPSGLTSFSMSGPGWTCGTLTCSRSDSLAATSVYPPITLVVNVVGTNSVTNWVEVSGGGDTDTSNNWAQDGTRIIGLPTNLVATATTTTQVSVTWSIPFGIGAGTSYAVFRAAPGADYVQVGTTLTNTYLDNSAAANTTYRYKVRIVEAGVNGPFSTPDFATTMLFTDDPIVARSTRIKRVHIEQLRTAANLARAAAGLSAATFTDSSLVGKRIKKVHVTELRTAINAARTALGLPTFPFADHSTIKAQHITELRNSVR